MKKILFLMVISLVSLNVLSDPIKYVPSGGDLQSAITYFGGSKGTIELDGPVDISATITVPENIVLEIYNGAIITVNSTGTLEINGGINAGLYKIFEINGSGKIEGDPKVSKVHPEWFGAVVNDNQNDRDAINKVLQSFKNSKIQFSDGTYDITGGNVPFYHYNNNSFIGNGKTSILKFDENSYLFVCGTDKSNRCNNINIEHLFFQGKDSISGTAIKSQHTWNLNISNCIFENFELIWSFKVSKRDRFENNIIRFVRIVAEQSTDVPDSAEYKSADLNFNNNMIYNNGSGVLSLWMQDGLDFTNNLIFGAVNENNDAFGIKVISDTKTTNFMRIVNNTFFEIDGKDISTWNYAAIYLKGVISQTIISDNLFGYTGSPISIKAKNINGIESGRIIISNNIIEHRTSATYGSPIWNIKGGDFSSGDDIYIENCSNINLNGNTLCNVGGYSANTTNKHSGIILNNCDNAFIDNNSISAYKYSRMKYGINIKNSSNIRMGDDNHIIKGEIPVKIENSTTVRYEPKTFRIELQTLSSSNTVYIYSSEELGYDGETIALGTSTGHYEIELPFTVTKARLISATSTTVRNYSAVSGTYGMGNRFSWLQGDGVTSDIIKIDLVNSSGNVVNMPTWTSFILYFSAYVVD